MSTAIDAITVPTREELVSRARALQPLLREHAAMADAERKAPDAVIDAVTAAGFYRLLSPRQFGGYEAEVRTVLEISESLGQADGSVAWLVGLGATAAWMAAHFSTARDQRCSPTMATHASREPRPRVPPAASTEDCG